MASVGGTLSVLACRSADFASKMNKRLRHTGCLVLIWVMVLATNTGCAPWMLPGQLLSFGAGLLLGPNSVSVTKECYLNGEPIDCAEVPF